MVHTLQIHASYFMPFNHHWDQNYTGSLSIDPSLSLILSFIIKLPLTGSSIVATRAFSATSSSCGLQCSKRHGQGCLPEHARVRHSLKDHGPPATRGGICDGKQCDRDLRFRFPSIFSRSRDQAVDNMIIYLLLKIIPASLLILTYFSVIVV